MASNVSVSKGVFVINKKKFVKKKKKSKSDETLMFSDPWYLAYKETWKGVEEDLENLQNKTFSNVLNNVVSFVEKPFDENIPVDLFSIPTAALLTGINMPDHSALFSTLCSLLRDKASPHVAILHAHKCKNIRQTIEQMTSQFMSSSLPEDEDLDSSDDEKIVKVKKSQSNMLVLQTWYKEKYPCSSEVDDEKSSRFLTSERVKCEKFSLSEEQEKQIPSKSPRKLQQRKEDENEENNFIALENKREEVDSVLKPVRGSPRKLPRKSDLSSSDRTNLPVSPKMNFVNDEISIRKFKNDIELENVASGSDLEEEEEMFNIKMKMTHVQSLDFKGLQHFNPASPLKAQKLEEKSKHYSEKLKTELEEVNEMHQCNSKLQKSIIETEEPRRRRTPRKVSRLIEELDEEEKFDSPRRLKNKNKCVIENNSVSSPRRRSMCTKSTRLQNSAKKSGIDLFETSDSEEEINTPRKRKRNEIHRFSTSGNAEQKDERKITPRKSRMSINDRGNHESDIINTQDRQIKGEFFNDSHVTPRKSARLKEGICYSEYAERNLVTQSEETNSIKLIQNQCRTPQKPLQSLHDSSKSKKATPLKEKWVCELSKVSPSTPLKIPKIILKQVDNLICEEIARKRSPRKIKFKEIDSEENVSESSSDKAPVTFMTNLEVLKSNSNENEKRKLVVVIPEFEKFSSKVLQDFILILRSSISTLPVVLIMGIATSIAAVHRSLPYRMSACLSIKAFQSPASVVLLNSILHEILFSSACPFWLGGRTFSFLMDVFLCYDLSVKGFIQAFKYCMMEHFCGKNWKIICCRLESLKEKIGMLTTKDLNTLQNIPSFSHYLKNLDDEEERQKLMSSEAFMKKRLVVLLKQLHEAMDVFHLSLNCLNVLVCDLPGKPLGSQVRELYGTGVSAPMNRTSEYKECFKLIGFLSREELISKLDKILALLKTKPNISLLNWFSGILEVHKSKVQEACVTVRNPDAVAPRPVITEEKMTRYAFKEKLQEISKDKNFSPFEKAREELVEFLSCEGFPKLLKPPATLPLAEVLMFDDLNGVRSRIVGAPRAAVHTALTTPSVYLECECCVQKEKDSIASTMPDICIIYKLYRECGRMINLYDWLQSFSAVINTKSRRDEDEDDGKQTKIDPEIQARFTRAVAELQFLGFLQISRRKVDHVTKLCFDGGL